MQKRCFFVLLASAVFLLISNRHVAAQSETPKFEAGAQFSTIHFSDLDITEPGFGFRLSYNVNQHLALEAEANIFPGERQDSFAGLKGGSKIQALFGIKAGTRNRRVGFFGKIRPGFVHLNNIVRAFEPCPVDCFPSLPVFNNSETDLALDVGAVVEFYTSRRTFIRVDAGDTIVHANPGKRIALPEFDPERGFDVTRIVNRSTSHNPQISIGIGVRLSGKAQGQSRDNAGGTTEQRAPRFEVGVQFTTLSVNPHSPICFDICLIGADRSYTEPGGGARFTYNLTNNISLEAEGNLFPRAYPYYKINLLGLAGRNAQGQFGVKIGKRFEKLGVFGKFRPGFVSFSKVSYVVSRSTIDIGFGPRTIGQFGERKRAFFSTDVGGAVEFYPSRHLMTRVDLGDTIIRYGLIYVPGYSLSNAIQRIQPETRHNFQFTAGVGFRF